MKKWIQKYYSLSVQVRASLWFLICTFLQRGISFISTPIFTRLLDTGDYGQYGVFNSWLEIVSVFVTLRLYYGVFVQGLVKYEDDRFRYVSSMQGLGLTLCSIWTVIYLVFHEFWNNLFKLTTVQMLAMLVMIWAAGTFSFWSAEQRNQYKYRALVILTLVVSLMKPIIGIILVVNSEDKATARILGLALVELAGYSWLFFVQMARGKKFFIWKYWRHALLLNIPLVPHYLSQTVLHSADRIMIRDMVGISEAGIYTLSYSISKIMAIFNTAINQTLAPWVYQRIKAGKEKSTRSVIYTTLVLIASVNILLIAFGPEAVAICAPNSYRNAVWIIPPVAMSSYFVFCYTLFAKFEFYFEKTKIISFASMGGAILNIILNYIFIKKFGYYAAGYTTLVCYLIYAALHCYFMRKICKEHLGDADILELRVIIPISVAFCALGGLFLVSYTNNVLRYILIAILVIIGIIFRKKIYSAVVSVLKIRKARGIDKNTA